MAAVHDARPFGLRILGNLEEPARLTRLRVQVLLSILVVGTNVTGVAAVFLLAAFVIPGPKPPDVPRVALENLALGTVYTAVVLLAGLKSGARRVTSLTQWLEEGRPPTEAEQRGVLQIPLLLTAVQGAYWLLGALVFAYFNDALSDRLAVQVALAISMGGVLTCANSYVIGERVVRPLAARALASGAPERLGIPGVRARSILAWLLSSAAPVVGMMVVAATALTRHGITTTRLAVTVLAFGGVVLLFGFRITFVAARANADPIGGLRRAVQRIGRGDLDVTVPIYDGTEIGQLQAGFNEMAAGLRERERIREVFEHHVGEYVARSALEGDGHLGGTVGEVGVLFVDIIGSTALATELPPDEVVGHLNRFFEVVVDVVVRHGGLINKFEGDGALAVFGAPARLDEPAGAALSAGLDLAEELRARGFEAGIGISAGPVVAGNIGAPARYEYTVIGDPVNEAARLTDLAKGVKGRVVASWKAVCDAGLAEGENWERGREVSLRGRPGRTLIATPKSALQ